MLPHNYEPKNEGIRLSSDRSRLVRWLYRATCYNTQKSERLFAVADRVSDAVFSPDAQRLIVRESPNYLVVDATTEEELSRWRGETDRAALAAGPTHYPRLAFARDGETFLFDAATGQPVTWFPVELSSLRSHPDNDCWIGARGTRVYLLNVEGEAPPRMVVPSAAPVVLRPPPAPEPASAPAPAPPPPDDDALIDRVEALLAQDRVTEATTVLLAAGRSSPKLTNALGVCYLRSGQIDLAAITFQQLVFQGSHRRHDVPTIYATNLATAMIPRQRRRWGNLQTSRRRLAPPYDDSRRTAARKARLSFLDRLRGLFGRDCPRTGFHRVTCDDLPRPGLPTPSPPCQRDRSRNLKPAKAYHFDGTLRISDSG